MYSRASSKLAKMPIHEFMVTRAKQSAAHKAAGGGTLFGKPRSEVIKHPGSFSAGAKKAGMSTSAYATKVLKPGSKASALTRKRAALAKAFATMRAKKA